MFALTQHLKKTFTVIRRSASSIGLLKNVATGLYLDADTDFRDTNNLNRDGAKAQAWIESGQKNQLWHLNTVSQSSGYKVINLINMHTGGYLNANTLGASAQTQVGFGPGNSNQQWKFISTGNSNEYVLVNSANGGYLDEDTNSSGSGNKILTWESSGTGKPNQRWVFDPKEVKVDLMEAFKAFARHFPGKIKKHTRGRLETRTDRDNWGVLFVTDRMDGNKLWQYHAYPKFNLPARFPLGYQHVWDGVILEDDGYISADCTVPYDQKGALWEPPIPRIHRYHDLSSSKTKTKYVSVETSIIEHDGSLGTKSWGYGQGTVYETKMLDLSDTSSQENMGERWTVTFGYLSTSERYTIDLGPKKGLFIPRYGLVGYHAASSWSDETYLANIQQEPSDINLHRRHNGTPQP